MKQQRQERRLVSLFLLTALGALTLAGCGGGLPAVSWFGVSSSDDIVYLAANEQVFALNLESGAELWAFPAEPEREIGPFYATPLLLDGTLVVGGYGDGQLYVLSKEDGTQEWVVETEGSVIAGAVPTDGSMVVGNGQGKVYRVEPETRDKELLFETEKAIWAKPLVDENGDRAYVASMDHHMYAFNLSSGEQLWSFEAGGALAGTPALSDGVLYFGSLNSTFYAIEAETGTQLWDYETDGWIWGGPLIHEGVVYFGDMSGKLYALDATDGSERWPAFEAEGGVRVTPVLSDGLLYFGTRQKKVYAVRIEDGTQQWVLSVPGAVYSQPIVQGEYLLIAPHNAKSQLMALDTESGAERWAYPPGEE